MTRTGSAAIFPGQGAQFVGMGRDFAEGHPAARRVFERANAVLGFDLAKACFEGPADCLERTDVQQPAILATSVAIWEAWRAAGGRAEEFSCAGGLSLGEYTALYAADALSLDDALRLVHRRGQLMQQAADASPSAMLCVIGAEPIVASQISDEARAADVLVPANFNCPGQVVLAGHRSACHRAAALAEKRGLRSVLLPVAGAFHSPLMQSAADGLRAELTGTNLATPRIPVVSNVNAQFHGGPVEIRKSLATQVTHAVRWHACVERMVEEGVTRFIEFGPGRVLSGLLRKINRDLTAVSIATPAAIPQGASAV